MQSNLILAHIDLSSSTQAHNDSLKSLNSMVEALDTKVIDQSASLRSLKSHVGNILERLSSFINWVHAYAAKKERTT